MSALLGPFAESRNQGVGRYHQTAKHIGVMSAMGGKRTLAPSVRNEAPIAASPEHKNGYHALAHTWQHELL